MTTKKLIRELHIATTSYFNEAPTADSEHSRHQALLEDCQKALQLTEQLMQHMPYAVAGAASQLSRLAAALSGLYERGGSLSLEIVPSKRAEKKAFEAMVGWVGYAKTLKTTLEQELQLHKYSLARVKEYEAEKKAAAKSANPSKRSVAKKKS